MAKKKAEKDQGIAKEARPIQTKKRSNLANLLSLRRSRRNTRRIISLQGRALEKIAGAKVRNPRSRINRNLQKIRRDQRKRNLQPK